MDVVLVIWMSDRVEENAYENERIMVTYTITGKDPEIVLATAQTILYEEFEEIAKIRGDKEYGDLSYQILFITRWRFLERFDKGIVPVVPKPRWMEFSWDIVPTKIVEAKKGEVR